MTDADNIADKICIANLQLRVIIYQGFPVLCLQAFRDIMPGEILTFSYGKEYFDLRGGCKVFNDLGVIIGKIEGNKISHTLPIAEINMMPKAKHCDLSTLKDILYRPFNSEMKSDFNLIFNWSICHTIETAISTPILPEQCNYLKTVLNLFKEADTSTKKYGVLSVQMKSPILKTELRYLHKQLLHICKEFHARHQAKVVAEKNGNSSTQTMRK